MSAADPSDPSLVPAHPESDASSPDTDTLAVVDGGFLSSVPGVPVPVPVLLVPLPGADYGKIDYCEREGISW